MYVYCIHTFFEFETTIDRMNCITRIKHKIRASSIKSVCSIQTAVLWSILSLKLLSDFTSVLRGSYTSVEAPLQIPSTLKTKIKMIKIQKKWNLKSWSISVPQENLSICFVYNSSVRILSPKLVVILWIKLGSSPIFTGIILKYTL